MTKRLQEALRLVRALPPAGQDEIAQLVLDRLRAAEVEHAASPEFEAARRRALKYLDRGFDLGGQPLTRDEIYRR